MQCAFLPLIIRVMALGLNLMNEEAGTEHIIKKGRRRPELCQLVERRKHTVLVGRLESILLSTPIDLLS